MFGTKSKNTTPKIINSSHSHNFLGLNNFNSKQSSNGMYTKNKLSVIKLNTLVSAIEIINKMIKYTLAK